MVKKLARHGRFLSFFTAAAAPALGLFNPAQAGFFDFLFGPQPQYQAVSPPAAYPGHFPQRRHLTRPRQHERVKPAAVAVGPQAPVDIMDDGSLKRGDVVMTQAGIRIFVGEKSNHHQLEDFRKISEVKKLSQRERSALAALDASAPGGPARAGVVTGRSVDDARIAAGEPTIDANGRPVRFVGP
ncbi:MAG TPA: hypothetical protein VEK34_09760 [Methylocella sp.]|nr:hypothetical protein [Methylocella sp.]